MNQSIAWFGAINRTISGIETDNYDLIGTVMVLLSIAPSLELKRRKNETMKPKQFAINRTISGIETSHQHKT